jgi:hypothetical protein
MDSCFMAGHGRRRRPVVTPDQRVLDWRSLSNNLPVALFCRTSCVWAPVARLAAAVNVVHLSIGIRSSALFSGVVDSSEGVTMARMSS